MIVAALASGFLQGVEATAGEVVTDSYHALRDRLVARYGEPAARSIAELQADPASPIRRETCIRQLKSLGVDRDPELGRLAERLNILIESPEAALELETDDPVERIRRSAGLSEVNRLLDEHINNVLRVRENFEVDDADLLSTRIGRSGLPNNVSSELTTLHRSMRQVIEQVALKIEEARYRPVENELNNMRAGMADRQRALRLVNADRQLHISYETLRLTVSFFGQLNQSVLGRLAHETSPSREFNMMLGNAILIVELTDYLIEFLERFELSSDLEDIHSEAQARVREARKRQEALEQQVNNENIDATVRRHTLEDIRNREEAFKELEREWARYLEQVRELRQKVSEVRGKGATLEVIRENARIQIETLQLVAMLRVLRQNYESIHGAIKSLQTFRLAPLKPNTVRRLLGIGVA